MALVETDSKANECSHLQFAAAEVGDVRFANVEPATTTIPGTDNLQEYNIVSYAMLGNKRYVRYNHGSWALEYVYNPEGYIKYWGEEEHYPYYYIKDHLGSVRQTYMRPTSTNKFLEQEMQYYPVANSSCTTVDTDINVSFLPAGVYVVHAHTSNGNY